MNGRLREAVTIWRMRNVRTGGDRAFAAYSVLMVGVVAVAPLVRALWLSATSAEGMALLIAVMQPANVSFMVAALWAGALLVGRDRGPALLPPFPLHVFATSGLKRSTVLRGPLFRNGLWLTVLTTTVAAFIALALANRGIGDPHTVIACTAGGLLAGVIAAIAWLVGQMLPRASVLFAFAVAALAVAGFPLTDLVVLGALATALIALVPTLLNRLNLTTLTAQAARWEAATVFAAGLDFTAATSTYRGRPSVGRNWLAVRPRRSLVMTFLVRDAVGAIRTPGRLLVGIVAVAAAGVLVTLAFAPAAPTVLLGAAAGLVLFTGLGPLTDGIRHAASVAADLPLYGISDGALLSLHVLFPLLVMVAVLVSTVLLCGMLSGTPLVGSMGAAAALGAVAMVIRTSNALKGMLPPALLTPIPTPVGDMSVLLQLAWALDGVIIVAIAGATAVAMLQAPVMIVVVVYVLVALAAGGVGISRWHSRGHTA